jgi:hypothetical protein
VITERAKRRRAMETALKAIDAGGHILEHRADILKHLNGRFKGRNTGV